MIDVSTIRQLQRNALLRAATLWLIAVGTTTAVLVGAAALTSSPTATTRKAPRSLTAIKPNLALSVARITELDRIPAFGTNLQPKSNEPVGGITFVRCTRLWRAMPDGSQPRLVLDMAGISSPTFAPSARTIAFLKDGREIWLTSADGMDTTKVGDIAQDGALPEGVRAMNLTWSPDGKEFAFALVAQGANPWTDGASIWKLELGAGYFMRDGFGWPTPAWQDDNLSYPMTGGERGVYLPTNDKQTDRWLARGGTPLGAAFGRSGWQGMWRSGFAAIRDKGRNEPDVIGYRRTDWRRTDSLQVPPPAGFTLASNAQPALSQDGYAVYADLVDPAGDPVLGILNVPAQSWNLIDYAWQPDASPAPTATKWFAERRAMWLITDFVDSLEQTDRKAMLVRGGSGVDPSVTTFKRWVGRTIGSFKKTPNGWNAGVVLFGQTDDGSFAYRDTTMAVNKKEDGRLEVELVSAGELKQVQTIEDAVTLLRAALPDIDVVLPEILPQGAFLNRKYPVDAYTWGASTVGNLNLRVPKAGDGNDELAFAFGDVNLSLGCGGVMDPRDEFIGVEAVSDQMKPTRQILWPATTEDLENGSYTVYGSLPKETLLELARQMVAAGAR